ncbi:MAG: biopolymer transporter ExbD [Flavobacteriales bacterium]|nr:biopolymer transporter ExbD [Flavobacteriales bacterium]|tara:strand:- start:5895 stop:6287 length:393 start_codon:yes stop_codon:yes gene_type:complete
MKIKNNNKYNSSFSMSSMTDIVFLLLIFFMLTSTLVSTSALEINLPKSESKDVKTKKLSISIDSSYNYYIENQIIEFTDLESILISKFKKTNEKSIILRVDKSVPIKFAVNVMDIAYKNNIKIILATNKK